MAVLKKCFCCSLKTGNLIIGALLIIGSILAVARAIKDVIAPSSYYNQDVRFQAFAADLWIISICDLVLSILMIVFSSLLLYGVNKGIAKYVKPILVMIPIDFVVRIIFIVLTAQYAHFAFPLSFVTNLVSVIGSVIDAFTWFFIYSHYKQLMEEGPGGTDSEMRPMK
eukprot:TRINITY_DN7557_c0_g1_i1.p1 TRINITY_DN7557_c0_g1~~TRINITY_DN7557_c0_g1_i1.p1  ORF type:complete len:168 (-),score=27.30 TRINITY_DN7557_c0_g1_i1:83-586(-)